MTVVQFVKAIVEESSLKGFDVLWADARERRMFNVGHTDRHCKVHEFNYIKVTHF